MGLEDGFDQISGSLRSLLLLWSAIERAAREEVARVNDGAVPRSAHGIAAVLNAWEDSVVAKHHAGSLGSLACRELRDRLNAHLRNRNGICHGLDGIFSAGNGKPARLTWTMYGETRSIAWDDLQESFAWLSRVPRAIFTISNATPDKIGNRFLDSPDNRAWWQCEFGLDLGGGGVAGVAATHPDRSDPDDVDVGMHSAASTRP